MLFHLLMSKSMHLIIALFLLFYTTFIYYDIWKALKALYSHFCFIPRLYCKDSLLVSF